MVETSVCFHAKSAKDSIHSIILEKNSENVLNIKKKKIIICDVAVSYNAHACFFVCFLEVEFISKSTKLLILLLNRISTSQIVRKLWK